MLIMAQMLADKPGCTEPGYAIGSRGIPIERIVLVALRCAFNNAWVVKIAVDF